MDCQGSPFFFFFFNNLNSLQFSLNILGGNTGFPLPNEVGCFPYHVKSPTQFFSTDSALYSNILLLIFSNTLATHCFEVIQMLLHMILYFNGRGLNTDCKIIYPLSHHKNITTHKS